MCAGTRTRPVVGSSNREHQHADAQRSPSRRMTRLLILLELPARPAHADVDAWLAAHVRGIAALADVERARLSVLEVGSRRCARAWDRMLELQLADEVERAGWADTGLCGDWLADLRSLGLRPQVLLVHGGTVIGPEERA